MVSKADDYHLNFHYRLLSYVEALACLLAESLLGRL